MLYNTYIDESGNTGNNLVDSTQKYFALAAVSIPQTKEASILSYIQVKFDGTEYTILKQGDILAIVE